MGRGKLAAEKEGNGVIAFAWFVWEHGHEGPPLLYFLDWKGC